MKFVIRPFENPSWLEDFFPGVDLLALKICNKPLLEYYLDFLYHHGVKDVMIVSPGHMPMLGEFARRSSEWGMNLRYEIAPDNVHLSVLEKKFSNFFKGEEYSTIEGPLFIHYNQKESTGFCGFEETIRFKGKIGWIGEFETSNINSIKDFYELSIDIIEKLDAHYNLPGFGFENGCYVGKGVVVRNKDSVSRRVHLGNYVLVDKNALVRQGSIIGDHVVVESNVEIEKSIIMENAVLGEGIFLKNKIIFENKVICPFSGVVVEVDERLLLPLLSRSSYRKMYLEKIQILIAMFLVSLATAPYLLFKAYLKIFQIDYYSKKNIVDKRGRLVVINGIDKKKMSVKSRGYKIANFFFLTHYEMLCKVVLGQVNLIGISRESCQKLRRCDYSEPVFFFSSLSKDPELEDHKDIFDYFYLFQPSAFHHIYALFKIGFSRIINNIR